MKTIANKSKNQYKYNCDNCGKEVSYKDNTLKQIHLKYKPNRTKKICDLCSECYEEIIKNKL